MKINRQGKSRTLAREELDLVTKYLPTEKHKLISLVLRKTAGRISEVVALRYENLTPGTILFPKQVVKGKLRPREIPISEDLFRVLTASQKLARVTGGGFDITPRSSMSSWRNLLNSSWVITPISSISFASFRRCFHSDMTQLPQDKFVL